MPSPWAIRKGSSTTPLSSIQVSTLREPSVITATGDINANFPGLRGGIPLVLQLLSQGLPMSVSLAPEFILSWRYPSYTTEQPAEELYSWGYLKSALQFDWSILSVGLSFSARSDLFSKGFQLATQPFGMGLEIHLALPSSENGILSFYTFGEADTSGSYYLNAGGGVGIVF